MSPPSPAASRLRYAATIVVGFAIDLGVGMALRTLLGAPLVAAAAGGFLIAVAANYALFEAWVFRRPDARFSAARLLQTYASALGALAVRLAAVFVLGFAPGEGAFADLARLGAAAGLSLVVNYLVLSRVFAGGGARGGGVD